MRLFQSYFFFAIIINVQVIYNDLHLSFYIYHDTLFISHLLIALYYMDQPIGVLPAQMFPVSRIEHTLSSITIISSTLPSK